VGAKEALGVKTVGDKIGVIPLRYHGRYCTILWYK
jgi:hypothetical protein